MSWREKIAAAVADRERAGEGHTQISRAAGLGPTFVRDLLERGQNPSIENLRKLATYLGLRMEDLVAEEDDPESMEAVGRRLRTLRLKLSKGEDSIAWWVASLREPGISDNDWIALEKGYRRPSNAELHALIRRTGVTSDWILFGIPDGLPFHLAGTLDAA